MSSPPKAGFSGNSADQDQAEDRQAMDKMGSAWFFVTQYLHNRRQRP
jgi:hypothetical protein